MKRTTYLNKPKTEEKNNKEKQIQIEDDDHTKQSYEFIATTKNTLSVSRIIKVK